MKSKDVRVGLESLKAQTAAARRWLCFLFDIAAIRFMAARRWSGGRHGSLLDVVAVRFVAARHWSGGRHGSLLDVVAVRFLAARHWSGGRHGSLLLDVVAVRFNL